MKKITIIFCTLFLIVQHTGEAQNWNVFNKSYRYNYKYDTNQLITQVMFADSVTISGSDTVYYLNRIGVECTGSCPTLTVALSPSTPVIVPNMPQFLQRQIRKYADGRVMFRDTAKLVLNPLCQINQPWLFDSVNNKSAVCISNLLQITFGISDSVKHILIDGTDTLKLSKHFGILQFPNLYNKNKYYRLAGIEYESFYDSIPLYGEKVPNAWDFYNFNSGDRFCYQTRSELTILSHAFTCIFGNFSIKNKTIANNGYLYTVEEQWDTCQTTLPSGNTAFPGSASARSYSNLAAPSLENRMYPGQIILTPYFPASPAYNIVRFGKNTSGTFFKYAGMACNGLSFMPTYMPSSGYEDSSAGYLQPAFQKKVAEIYGVGLGLIDHSLWESGWQRDYCQTCAVKNSTLYHGNQTFVGIKELKQSKEGILLYPNPLQDKINLRTENSSLDELRITNLLGQTIFELHRNLDAEETELDLSAEKSGVYVIQLFKKGHLVSSQKLIKN